MYIVTRLSVGGMFASKIMLNNDGESESHCILDLQKMQRCKENDYGNDRRDRRVRGIG